MEQHCDTGSLALGALGEALDRAADEHLRECGRCQHELARMTATVSVARSTLGETSLQSPPSRVWQGVHRETGLGAALRRDPLMPADSDAALATRPAAAEAPPAAPVVSLADARARRSGIRRFVTPLVAAAAAAALVAGIAVGWQALAPRASDTVLASASLEALPAWAGSTGAAEIVERADGERVVRIDIDAPAVSGAVHEVWLLTPEVDGLISLGLLADADGEFVIPAGVDLERYSVVDVSAEPLDGDPAHSGDSVVRGALES
ncbi:anti-sigma-K factor rskA [Microcella putealis]|uniref:Anti-sigma-K factor rskA n=1 Tax=Microcella putealis TaxID=337005 RepID=A0A4Q7LS07_9MICO|nr:anti-sigma factor [Microcella putealis]RZS57616.1 anti-sigma-K factor rskA [Microcella putealis]TQM24683.1 anti-sigma-K factor rskA [Microcella putealis]